VQIRKADRKFTAVQDDNLKEPIGQVRRSQRPINIDAQIKQEQQVVIGPGGAEEHEDGYLLFLTKDLTERHLEIERGDLIVQMGDGKNARETELYITRFRWMGHYPSASGPTLLRAYFMDRQPAQNRGAS